MCCFQFPAERFLQSAILFRKLYFLGTTSIGCLYICWSIWGRCWRRLPTHFLSKSFSRSSCHANPLLDNHCFLSTSSLRKQCLLLQLKFQKLSFDRETPGQEEVDFCYFRGAPSSNSRCRVRLHWRPPERRSRSSFCQRGVHNHSAALQQSRLCCGRSTRGLNLTGLSKVSRILLICQSFLRTELYSSIAYPRKFTIIRATGKTFLGNFASDTH